MVILPRNSELKYWGTLRNMVILPRNSELGYWGPLRNMRSHPLSIHSRFSAQFFLKIWLNSQPNVRGFVEMDGEPEDEEGQEEGKEEVVAARHDGDN